MAVCRDRGCKLDITSKNGKEEGKGRKGRGGRRQNEEGGEREEGPASSLEPLRGVEDLLGEGGNLY